MSEQSNKVTVVTVCRNCARMLEIESVETLSYPDIEYVIVDGASDDDTLNVIKKHEGKIDQWVSEPDRGIYDAMNKAVTMAKGDWMIFMNAGDVFASDDCVEKAMACAYDADVVNDMFSCKWRERKQILFK